MNRRQCHSKGPRPVHSSATELSNQRLLPASLEPVIEPLSTTVIADQNALQRPVFAWPAIATLRPQKPKLPTGPRHVRAIA